MTPVEEIRRLVAAGEIRMRVVAGETRRNPVSHALGQRSAVAVCGFYPTGLWGDEAQPTSAKCRHCVRQLKRAGFFVSWANAIVREV